MLQITTCLMIVRRTQGSIYCLFQATKSLLSMVTRSANNNTPYIIACNKNNGFVCMIYDHFVAILGLMSNYIQYTSILSLYTVYILTLDLLILSFNVFHLIWLIVHTTWTIGVVVRMSILDTKDDGSIPLTFHLLHPTSTSLSMQMT